MNPKEKENLTLPYQVYAFSLTRQGQFLYPQDGGKKDARNQTKDQEKSVNTQKFSKQELPSGNRS
ncbi:MAG: hypothetical protein CMI18_12420 [Opitutaceae bacterium]|nr:hypothetical protein [Opitutaceae bacterium]